VTAGGLEVFRLLGGLLQQQTNGLLSNWQELDAEARKRQRTTGAQLRSLSEILQALVAEQRSVHASLSKLASHICEEERAVREDEQARKRAEAMRLTTAGCAALQRGSVAQAATLFASAWENHATPHTAFNYALALLLGGRDAEARRLLEEPVLKSCSPVEVQILRALRALLDRDLAAAAREAEAGLQLSPDHSMLKQILATAAFKHSPGAAIQQSEAIPPDLRTWLASVSAPVPQG
jgi:hypothetical protein